MQEMPQFADMPEAMRKIMKSSIEQAKKAFDSFITASQQAMQNLDATSSATESMKTFNEKIAEFTKANAEANFALAMKLADAKQLSDVVELQSQHVRQQMETFNRQLEELRKLTAEIMKETTSKVTSSTTSGPTGMGI